MADPDTRRAARIATLVAIPAALLTAALLLWLLGGPGAPDASRTPDAARTPVPSGPVTMASRDLAPRAATVCRALLAKLPSTIRELPQRVVTSGAEQNAAYGEPPILLRCGVEPVTLPKTSTAVVYPLSGACWLPKKTREGTVWTTLDREVPVSVTVPKSLPEPGQWVAALSPHVADTPARERAPSGCRE
ncbi:MAG: DUF3515 family protein [Micromonosporaceae bacterium]|nr:DUF3515 family protein [Micromonosporaceae bacterium]